MLSGMISPSPAKRISTISVTKEAASMMPNAVA